MSQHDPVICLRDMLEHAREAVALSRGKTHAELAKDRVLQLALVQLVQIVGEAAARIPKKEQVRCPGIPWAGVIGMRNKLIHGYDELDLKILWDTLRDDLPRLIGELKKIVPPETGA